MEDALRKIALLEDRSGGGGGGSGDKGGGGEAVGSVAATLQLHQLQGKLHSAQEELFQSEAGEC